MKNKRLIIRLFALGCFGLFGLNTQAQETVPAAGGEATGTGGTVSYTVGQVSYQHESGSKGSVSEGVQQPFEIYVTSINEVPGITLNIKAYPNPTQGDLWLNVEELSDTDLSYQIYDFNGKLLKSDQISNSQTLVSLQDFASATYFLRVMSENSEIKTFKIIKN